MTRLFIVLALAVLVAGCATPVVSHQVHQAPPQVLDVATARRQVEQTLLRARVPKTTMVEITEYTVTFRMPGTGHFVLPPILYPGIAGAVAYNQARSESRGTSHQIFFDTIGAIEVYGNGYVFVKNTGGHVTTKVLFAPGDDAQLFAEALRVLAKDLPPRSLPSTPETGKETS